MSKSTILLVHSASSVCDEVADVLRNDDYTVFCAYSRHHAEALVHTIQIDTVMYHTKLDDPMRPFGLGKKLKSENQNLRVLALKSFSDSANEKPEVPPGVQVGLWPVGDNRKALLLLLKKLLSTEKAEV